MNRPSIPKKFLIGCFKSVHIGKEVLFWEDLFRKLSLGGEVSCLGGNNGVVCCLTLARKDN